MTSTAEATVAKRDHRQEVTDLIVKMLEEGVASWQKPWEPSGVPMNPTTGREYRGGNAVHRKCCISERQTKSVWSASINS
jgi:antirestriction protein ArdC